MHKDSRVSPFVLPFVHAAQTSRTNSTHARHLTRGANVHEHAAHQGCLWSFQNEASPRRRRRRRERWTGTRDWRWKAADSMVMACTSRYLWSNVAHCQRHSSTFVWHHFLPPVSSNPSSWIILSIYVSTKKDEDITFFISFPSLLSWCLLFHSSHS